MSLFPDRSIISAQSRELALIDQGLTSDQRKQLAAITQGYLNEFGLIGYENTRAVMPVIKECLADGLKETYRRDRIIQSDNLTLAFRKGYEARKSIFKVVETELKGLIGSSRYEGVLALSQDMVKGAVSELEKRAYIVDPLVSKRLVEVANMRRPIFQHLVKFCRDQIEENIPGSKETKLTEEQQAGLIRHLVFSWITYGESRILLETEDFMVERKSYLAQVPKADEPAWQKLAELTGQDSKYSAHYLKDMSAQVADLLSNVPDKPNPETSTTLELVTTINSAFKTLEDHFLVVNPFNKFHGLSENPADQGRSIWDVGRSAVFTINGVNYRVPAKATLNLAGYLMSGQNPVRGRELILGGKHVESLLDEIAKQRQSYREILDRQTVIDSSRKNLTRIKDTINSGRVPSGAAMSRSEVVDLTEKQKYLMKNELHFLQSFQERHKRLVAMALGLLPKYTAGQVAEDNRSFNSLQILYDAQAALRLQALYYIRERLAPRIRGSELRTAYLSGIRSNIVNLPDYLNTELPGSLDSTVLDILDFRNKFWMCHYLGFSGRYRYHESFTNQIFNWTTRGTLFNKYGSVSGEDEIVDSEEELKGSTYFVARKARTEFGPAEIILHTLVRLAPEPLWPTYPVNIYDVAHNKYPDDISDPFFYALPGREKHEERYPTVISRFQEWLSDCSFHFDDKLLNNLVRPWNMTFLISNGHLYHRISGIEPQVKDWYENQSRRMHMQVKNYNGGYYKKNPTDFVGPLIRTLNSKERSLERLKEIATRRLKSKVDQLHYLGLIRVEKN